MRPSTSTTSLTSTATLQPAVTIGEVRATPTPSERLRTDLCSAMRRVATETGRSHLFSDDQLAAIAENVVAQAHRVPPGVEPRFDRLGVARLLLDRKGWDHVDAFLEEKGCPRVPDLQTAVQDPLQCDLESGQSPRMQPDAIAGWTKFLRAKADLSVPGTLSLRSTLDQHQLGGPAILTRVGPIGWQELIGRNTRVVLPLFSDNRDNTIAPEGSEDRNRNGRDAAAVINTIHHVAPHVASVNISAGHGPRAVDGLQKIDLSNLVPPVPEITIRIKELATTKVEIYAPEGVAIKVERDGARLHMTEDFRNAAAPIQDIKLYRTTGLRGTEDFEFTARTGMYTVQRPIAPTQHAMGAGQESASEEPIGPEYQIQAKQTHALHRAIELRREMHALPDFGAELQFKQLNEQLAAQPWRAAVQSHLDRGNLPELKRLYEQLSESGSRHAAIKELEGIRPSCQKVWYEVRHQGDAAIKERYQTLVLLHALDTLVTQGPGQLAGGTGATG